MGKLLLVAKSCDYLGRNVFCGWNNNFFFLRIDTPK
jgi:hypothetical protein